LLALLGPSGSGKTTILRVIAGLARPDRGTVWLDGIDVTHAPIRARSVGFVFQNYALFRHMTVIENIAFGLTVMPRKQRLRPRAIVERCESLMALMQLEGLERRYPTQLSGGQQQRVALARALAIEPRVLLLDEPFGALDAPVRDALRQVLRRIHERLQVTTVLVTHDQDEALEVADRIAVIASARLHQVGTPVELHDTPATKTVAGFLSSLTWCEARAQGGEARIESVVLPATGLPDGARLRVALRTADLGLRARPTAQGSPLPVRLLVPPAETVSPVMAETSSADGPACAAHAVVRPGP
jgi:sulfate transport system ATP-binding protein